MELLKVYLSPINEADFKVSVNGSRVGQAETDSTLPFWQERINWLITVTKSLEAIRFRPEDFQRFGEQDWMVQVGLLAQDRKAFHCYFLKNIGKALYQSLFPPGSKVEKVLQNAINLAQNNATQLHIQLEIAADILGSTRLPDYPWELMHDDRGFLTQHQVTFSRYITYDAAPPKLPSMEQVNVLLISSAASDPENGLEKLPQQEQLAVRRGLGIAEKEGHIRLVELKPPTLKALRDYLTEHRNETAPHVIHFDGHGLFGKCCNNTLDNGQLCRTIHKGIKINNCQRCHASLPEPQGYLVFEDETGKPNYVSAKEISILLQQNSFIDDSKQLRGVALVVLSACQSGLALTGTSVFNGVAQSLIAHRTPAVVAMQYSVSVPGATAFSEQFYRSLGQKEPLAMIVSQSREAMGVEGNQWYRPVLYLRWQDNEGGQLFAAPTPVIPTRVKLKPSVFVPSASLVITALVFGVRLLGILQASELKMFDQMMRLRPNEGIDPRLLVVTIDETDYKYQDHKGMKRRGSLSDTALAQLLEKLEPHQPGVIGLDIIRDFSVSGNQPELAKKLQNTDNFIAICIGNDPTSNDSTIREKGIEPPPEVPVARLGFADVHLDNDGILRRHLWFATFNSNTACNTEVSLSLKLALYYLAKKGIKPKTTHSGDLLLGKTRLQRLQSKAGGYQNLQQEFYQMLLNYRFLNYSESDIAQQVPLRDILENNFDPSWVKDRIVLIGVSAKSVKDDFYTPYSLNQQPDQTMRGVFIQAQMVSQIISAALNGRPLLRVLPSWGDIFYIWLCSLAGGAFVAAVSQKLAWHNHKIILVITSIGVIFVISYSICLFLLIHGYWLPFLPSTIASLATSVITFGYIHRFPYQRQ
ncbi:CHASE2 domain-containing protein [Dendronalium sp. ChiSLP03b]|uniref:CHASE2 domain-containing protein n=1 Tax=Dendronalium sp. ChiSLP03b TaxID=3075381 RepID=UPI00391986A0